MASTTTLYDPVTGAIDYTFTTDQVIGSTYVVTATDYDLDDAQPWASYTIRNETFGPGIVVLKSAEARMDDGTGILLEKEYFGALGNIPVHYMDRWTTRDEQGRLDYMYETYERVAPHGQIPDTSLRAFDYNPNTGKLDFVLIQYFDGHQLAVDYDPVTGQLDYALATGPDGRVLATDYNPATGLLDYVITRDPGGHMIAEDYDASGRLDYAIESWADGRKVATDYDLADQFPWTTFSVTYDAAGQVESWSFT